MASARSDLGRSVVVEISLLLLNEYTFPCLAIPCLATSFTGICYNCSSIELRDADRENDMIRCSRSLLPPSAMRASERNGKSRVKVDLPFPKIHMFVSN